MWQRIGWSANLRQGFWLTRHFGWWRQTDEFLGSSNSIIFLIIYQCLLSSINTCQRRVGTYNVNGMNGYSWNCFLFRRGVVVLVSLKIFQVLGCSLVGGTDLQFLSWGFGFGGLWGWKLAKIWRPNERTLLWCYWCSLLFLPLVGVFFPFWLLLWGVPEN